MLLEPVKFDIKRTTKNKTGIIFLFMNVKIFRWNFSVLSFYIQLYTKSKIRIGKFENLF